jgi:hypothetical protein
MSLKARFVSKIESQLTGKLDTSQLAILKLISNEINNGKRVEESELLRYLIEFGEINFDEFKNLILAKYGYEPTERTIDSVLSNINLYFINRRDTIIGLGINELIDCQNRIMTISDFFKGQLLNPVFKQFLIDNIEYGIHSFSKSFNLSKFKDGFSFFHKYSRKDICRILNWDKNEESTMYGYSIKYQTCPIFVNYHKEDNIASSTKFEDKFLNNNHFQWFSKPRRNLESKDVTAIRSHNNELKLSLFVKKSNGEGSDFYYIGDVKPINESFEETTIKDDHGKSVSVVKVIFKLNQPVEDSLFDYLTK